MNTTLPGKGSIKLWVSVILAVLVIIVVLQNTTEVETDILFFSVTAPRAVLLLVTFLAGFVAGVLAFSRRKKA